MENYWKPLEIGSLVYTIFNSGLCSCIILIIGYGFTLFKTFFLIILNINKRPY